MLDACRKCGSWSQVMGSNIVRLERKPMHLWLCSAHPTFWLHIKGNTGNHIVQLLGFKCFLHKMYHQYLLSLQHNLWLRTLQHNLQKHITIWESDLNSIGLSFPKLMCINKPQLTASFKRKEIWLLNLENHWVANDNHGTWAVWPRPPHDGHVDSCFRKAFRITTCQSMKPTALLNHWPQSLTKKPQTRRT